jgi:hypothetical protein
MVGPAALAVIEGPAWAQQGLDQREGRYPLAVEAPLLSMVATLLPGVSTLTQFARYYGLYWAIADVAEQRQLDAAACRQLVRRAELLFASVSHRDSSATMPKAHGVDALGRGLSLVPAGPCGSLRRKVRVPTPRGHGGSGRSTGGRPMSSARSLPMPARCGSADTLARWRCVRSTRPCSRPRHRIVSTAAEN